MSSWQVAWSRSFVAALAVALLLPEARRDWTWRKAFVGLFYALCLTSFVLATKNTTSANAIFLQSTAPLYLVIAGPWILGERTRWVDWASLAMIAAGMVLIFWQSDVAQRLAPDPALGNALGVLSGLMWACTVCGLRWLGRVREGGEGSSSMAPILLGNLIAIAFTTPFLLPWTVVSAGDATAILYLGVFQVALAYWLLTRAVSKLPALETSLLVMLEPALNPVWTWLLHGERPRATALVGGALILVATLAPVLWSSLRKPTDPAVVT